MDSGYNAYLQTQSQQTQTQGCQLGEKQADVYDQHRQAVIEWHASCKAFQVACQQRDQARARLDKISQVLAETLAAAMLDPTVPQPAPPPPINGSLSQRMPGGGALY